MTNDMPDTPPARPAARRLPLLLSAIAAGAIVGYGIVTQWNAMQQKAGGRPADKKVEGRTPVEPRKKG